MGERFRQANGRIIEWPTLGSAENLEKLADKNEIRELGLLALHERRRISHMPPPSLREMGEYLGGVSTSVITYLLKDLVKKEYLNNLNEENEIATRSTTIRIDFQTVKLKNGEFAHIADFPEVEGLTFPRIKKAK